MLNHAHFSRIACYNKRAYELLARVNIDLCDHIYSDPFGHFRILDLKNKYFKGDIPRESREMWVLEMLDFLGVFDHLKKNPRPAIHHSRLLGKPCLYIELDVEHPGLERYEYPSQYIKRHPEYLETFIKKCKDGGVIQAMFEEIFFIHILSVPQLVGRHRAAPHRVINVEFLDDEIRDYSPIFKEEYIKYLQYPKVVVDEVEVNYSEELIKKDMEIAGSFLREHGGVVSGSAALAFFNLTMETNHQVRFVPDDIDVVITDKATYNECKKTYVVTEERSVMDYDDGIVPVDITYILYKGRKVNLILTEGTPEAKVAGFDMEFCRLIWDGKDFDRSSPVSLMSAYHGRATYKLNITPTSSIVPTRAIKYMKRGYDVILL